MKFSAHGSIVPYEVSFASGHDNLDEAADGQTLYLEGVEFGSAELEFEVRNQLVLQIRSELCITKFLRMDDLVHSL